MPRKPALAAYDSDDYDYEDTYTDVDDDYAYDEAGEGEEEGEYYYDQGEEEEAYYYSPSAAVAAAATEKEEEEPPALKTVDADAADYDALVSLVPRLSRAWEAQRPLAPSLTEEEAVAALRGAALDAAAALAELERRYLEERRRRGADGTRVLQLHTRHLPGPPPAHPPLAQAPARREVVRVPAERLQQRRWYVCGLPGAGCRTLVERVCRAAARRGAAHRELRGEVPGGVTHTLKGWHDAAFPELVLQGYSDDGGTGERAPLEKKCPGAVALQQCSCASVYERWEAALLVVVSVAGDHLTNAIVSGTLAQWLVRLAALGVDRVVVAVNGMDAAGYARDAFEEAADNVRGIVQRCLPQGLTTRPGVPDALVGLTFVPVSGLRGANVDGPGDDGGDANDADEMPWYTAPSLLSLLLESTSVAQQQRRSQLPLRCKVLAPMPGTQIYPLYVLQGVLPAATATVMRNSRPSWDGDDGAVTLTLTRAPDEREPTGRPTWPGEYAYAKSYGLRNVLALHSPGDATAAEGSPTRLHIRLSVLQAGLPSDSPVVLRTPLSLVLARYVSTLFLVDAAGDNTIPAGADGSKLSPFTVATAYFTIPSGPVRWPWLMPLMDTVSVCPQYSWVAVYQPTEALLAEYHSQDGLDKKTKSRAKRHQKCTSGDAKPARQFCFDFDDCKLSTLIGVGLIECVFK